MQRILHVPKFWTTVTSSSRKESEAVVNLKIITHPIHKCPRLVQMFKDTNLSKGADIEKRRTNLLCKLVRRLYTVEEIEKGIVHDSY